MSHATITIQDYSDEFSTFGYEATALTAGNIVAQTALHVALQDATEDLVIGTVAKQQIAQILLDEPSRPANAYAQREMKALVTYQALTSGKKFQVEVACPALTGNIIPGSDEFDLTADDVAAWVTAFVAVAKSPDDITDSVIVLSMRLVGRNI